MIDVELTNYRVLQLRLRKMDPALKKAVNKEIRTIVAKVAAVAKADASQYSTTIPKAIRPTVTATGYGLRVSKGVPIAVLNESKSGSFRHPLFGNKDYWFNQIARQPARRAVEDSRAEVMVAARLAAQVAIKESGL